MTYTFRLSPGAQRYLDGLNDDVVDRVLKKLKDISKDPFRFLDHYEGEGYKLRIGDHRAIVDVDITKKDLFVRVLDKRGRIYK